MSHNPILKVRARDELTLAGLKTKSEQILGPQDERDSEIQEWIKEADTGRFWIFRALTKTEIHELRQAARDKYIPFETIDGIWHPVYQLECVKINHEHSFYRLEADEKENASQVKHEQ